MRPPLAVPLSFLFALLLTACGGDGGTGPDDTEPVRVTIVPGGWFVAPVNSDFRVGLDSTQKRSGRAAAFIASVPATTSGFTALSQAVRADAFRGERVRLSAWVRTKNVQGDGAGLYMRVDGPHFVQAFDNMAPRRLLGTSGWTQKSVVLNVPDNALGISFGLLMLAAGDVMIDDLTLEVVDTSVPLTSTPIGFSPIGDSAYVANYYAARPAAPVNAGFEGQ